MSCWLWVLVVWLVLALPAALFASALFKRGHPDERDR